MVVGAPNFSFLIYSLPLLGHFQLGRQGLTPFFLNQRGREKHFKIGGVICSKGLVAPKFLWPGWLSLGKKIGESLFKVPKGRPF